jgi:endonuclease/exonuclease/phosphatase family metal-dependent hydrolase
MITVATYNIHKAHSSIHGCRLSALKDGLSEIDADVICLQEVQDINTKRHAISIEEHGDLQTIALKGNLYPYIAYGANAIYKHGNHGNAILSKYPIQVWQNIDISDHKFEQRGILHAILEHPNHGKIHVICVHFGLFKSSRARQANALIEHVKHSVLDNEPLIIAGDFNDWNLHVHHILCQGLELKDVIENTKNNIADKRYSKRIELGRTFPSLAPWFKLDRLYVRGFEVQDAHVKSGHIWQKRSDHMPIQATLKI